MWLHTTRGRVNHGVDVRVARWHSHRLPTVAQSASNVNAYCWLGVIVRRGARRYYRRGRLDTRIGDGAQAYTAPAI